MKLILPVFKWIFFGICFTALGQTTFYDLSKSIANLPEVIHFNRSDYMGDSEFWSSCRGLDGVLYFGNNDGVLIYDGERWVTVALPNSSSVRSLLASEDGTIYAGGYNEFGMIRRDSIGNYFYQSMIDKTALTGKELENIEQINQLGDNIIFRCYKQLIVVSDNRNTIVPSSVDFMNANVVNGIYYVQDIHKGIFSFDPITTELTQVFDAQAVLDNAVKGIWPSEKQNELFIILENGLIYKGNIDTGELMFWEDVFKDQNRDQIISSIKKGDTFVLGTLSSKIRMLDSGGKRIPVPATFSEIQNPSVLNLLAVDNGIWVMLYNGLDFINAKTKSVKFFEATKIYDLIIYNQRLFVASNKGVFASKITKDALGGFRFELIPGLQGQAWSMSVRDGKLFIGHHKGLYVYENEKVTRLTDFGIWGILDIPGKQNMFLAGGYLGLSVIVFKDGKYVLRNRIKGFSESSRDIIAADEPYTFWVCHGYKGVFKIKMDQQYDHVNSIDHYTDNNGFKSPYNINVFRWNKNIVFTTNNGVYKYYEPNNTFVPYSGLNRVLDTSKNTRKILQIKDTTWVVQDNQVGYFISSDSLPKVVSRPFLKVKGQLNRGMETILPMPKHKVLIGTTDGIFLFDLKDDYRVEANTVINTVAKSHNQEVMKLPLHPSKPVSLPFDNDLIRFEFAVPQLISGGEIQYKYHLEGLNIGWSDWSETNFKEYAHLKPGSYKFSVKSRDLNGNQGNEASYRFEVLPKWYQTISFRLFFLLVFISLLWLGSKLIKRSIEKENLKIHTANLKEKRMLELEIESLKLQHEKERIKKDKELLENDIIDKSKELANYTMQLVNKKDIFNDLQIDLKQLRTLVRTQNSKEKITEIFRKLHQHKIGEEYMEVFDVNFEKVHHHFFEKLKELHPNLSRKELRLCAFIKMDLSNKEISPLLNISVRGVETLRYRLRKKLDLEHQDNLQEFLTDLENDQY